MRDSENLFTSSNRTSNKRKSGRRCQVQSDCASPPPLPRSVLPFSSSDTFEGSAHGNNPEKRARKASRKKSDMFPETADYLVAAVLPLAGPGPVSPLHHHPVAERRSSVMSGGTSAQNKCSSLFLSLSSPLRLPDTSTHRCSSPNRRTGDGIEMTGRGWGGWERDGGGGVREQEDRGGLLSFLKDLMPPG